MTPDDILYFVLLLFSLVCGFVVQKVECWKQRQILCSLVGLLLLTAISGYHLLHPVILTVVNAVIVLNVSKKYCHIISFVFCFIYLMFIRLCDYFDLPSPPEVTNTALMIMVLKMVGLAFELNMQYLKDESSKKSNLKEIYTRINPSFFGILQYSFCYAGVLVGPYYKYSTYEDMFHKPYSMCVPHLNFLKKRIVVIPLYIILYLISDYFFPLSLAASEEIWSFPFLYRVWYILPWFFSFRMRLYVAFVLGECICINIGLGAYPQNFLSKPGAGPTNLAVLQEMEKNPDSHKVATYDFESVRSMDELASEFRPTMREGIRYWNMTVQYWLWIYIYKKTAASKSVKMFTTMLVSAVWHGVRPGYYLSLLGTPLLLLSEIQVEKAFRKNLSVTAKKMYDFMWYFIKMPLLSYMGIAFILLDLKAVIHYWNSIYYVGHIFIMFMFIAAFLKSHCNKKVQRNDKKFLSELKNHKSS